MRCTRRRAQQSGFQCLEHRARAVASPKFGEDAGDVILDCSFGRPEGAGDLPVAVAAGHEANHFGLSRSQFLTRCFGVDAHRTASAQQPLGHRRLKHGRTPGDRANGRKQLLIGNVLEKKAPRAGTDAVKHNIAVVEGSEDQRRG